MPNLRKSQEPLRRPFLRSIRPRSLPLRLSPRVSHDDEPFAIDLDSFENGIGVAGNQAFDFYLDFTTACGVEFVVSGTEEAVGVGSEELFFPESVRIEDIFDTNCA